jgi:conjugal transfer/entry exclusion protein
MNPPKQSAVILFISFFSVIGFTQTGQAKSLYAITNFECSTISAYRISGNQIQKQIDTESEYFVEIGGYFVV